MTRRKMPIPGVWAVLLLILGWAVIYFLLTGAIPETKRAPDPAFPESERLSPVLEPEVEPGVEPGVEPAEAPGARDPGK